MGAVPSYTFPNVTANHTIFTSFESDASDTVIIDNGDDPGTSYTGTWSVSSASGWYDTEALWSRDGRCYPDGPSPLPFPAIIMLPCGGLFGLHAARTYR